MVFVGRRPAKSDVEDLALEDGRGGGPTIATMAFDIHHVYAKNFDGVKWLGLTVAINSRAATSSTGAPSAISASTLIWLVQSLTDMHSTNVS